MPSTYALEACVESFAEAKLAQDLGAHQIELCANLEVGGTTPEKALILKAKEELDLKVKVMIRPRGGNFVYNVEEIEAMKQSILYCQSIGIDGVVFGILHKDNTLNIDQTLILSRLAGPMEVTIHRAIDDTPNILAAIQLLKNVPSVHCILSAGQANSAVAGAQTLSTMVQEAGDGLIVIPGGGVRKDNVQALHEQVGSSIYHGTKIVGPLST
ncbi:MAG: copper homeostasis protein CutC [Bacteroidota bacterium]